MQQNPGPNQQQDIQYDIAETEDDGIGVGSSRQSKITIIILMAILLSAVIYFMFFKGATPKHEEDSREIIVNSTKGQKPVQNKLEDVVSDESFYGLDSNEEDFKNPKVQQAVPALPEVPKLPDEIKRQIAGSVTGREETFTKEEVDKMIEDKLKQAMEEQMAAFNDKQKKYEEERIRLLEEQNKKPSGIPITLPKKKDNASDLDLDELYGKKTTANKILASDLSQDKTDEEILAQQKAEEAANLAKIQKKRALQERKAAPIFKMSGGNGPSNSLPQDSEAIILSYTDSKLDIKSTTPDISSTKIADLSRVILEGKIISAVLETAIDTDLSATVRAVITRDVYAEEGKNILIPKGSRVIGTYETSISSGQTRVTVNWTRIIRVDGLSLNIASVGADRLGRAGVKGELDNRYAQRMANSFLSSVLSVGTALISEKVSGSTGITTTLSSLTGETTTTSGSASDYALVDATEDMMDTAKDIVDEISEQGPVIRIPQGEKITIMVTQDVTLPLFKKGS